MRNPAHKRHTSNSKQSDLIRLRKEPADRPSVFNPGRSFFSIAPPMRRLNIVWVIVSPCSSHPFGISVVWDNIVVIAEFFFADGTDPVLFHNLPVQQFPHFCR